MILHDNYLHVAEYILNLILELAFTVAVEDLQSTDPALLGLTTEPLRGMMMVRVKSVLSYDMRD